MAYATAEDRAFFKSKGWIQDDESIQFHDNGLGKFISASWYGKRVDSLDVPAPEDVMWIAVALDDQGYIIHPVDQAQNCQSPVTAFVLAELKQWKA